MWLTSELAMTTITSSIGVIFLPRLFTKSVQPRTRRRRCAHATCRAARARIRGFAAIFNRLNGGLVLDGDDEKNKQQERDDKQPDDQAKNDVGVKQTIVKHTLAICRCTNVAVASCILKANL